MKKVQSKCKGDSLIKVFYEFHTIHMWTWKKRLNPSWNWILRKKLKISSHMGKLFQEIIEINHGQPSNAPVLLYLKISQKGQNYWFS